MSVRAFVDTCAENLVTERFIRRCGLSFNSKSSGHVRVADGTSLPTLGTVTLRWQFQSEEGITFVRFHVVSKACMRYQVVLGGAFLWNSGTLTKHKSRLRLTSRDSMNSRIFLQGTGHLLMNGICEDHDVEMFPDLASDIPAMSTDFAHRIGAEIDSSTQCRIAVEIPGDRTIMTRGRVADVKLQLGEDLYQQTFYLIDGLPADILLDADFLIRTNAFIKYSDHIMVSQDLDAHGQGMFLAVSEQKEHKHRWWKRPKTRESLPKRDHTRRFPLD